MSRVPLCTTRARSAPLGTIGTAQPKNTLLLIDTHLVLPIPITLSAVVKAPPLRLDHTVTARPKVSSRTTLGQCHVSEGCG